jgi:hypothetical protein
VTSEFIDKNMDNSNATTHREELPQHLLEAIHKLIQTGASHQAICSVLGLELEEVQQILDEDSSQDSKLIESIREKSKKYRTVKDKGLMTSQLMAPGNYIEECRLEVYPTMSIEQAILSPKKRAKISEISMESSSYDTQDIQTQLNEDILPTFIYSSFSDQLHRTSLVTGEQSTHRVPSYTFKYGFYWSEVPGGNLLITGGGDPTEVREVVRIDTRREFAVSEQPPMLSPRKDHTAVYHAQHLYVLGGVNGHISLSMCERFVCAENRWETLPLLPKACCLTSGIVVESSLYALGGCHNGESLDLVQKLSLESLTWELMQLRLPYPGGAIPCFKLRDTEVYLVVNGVLCSFTTLQVLPLKTLTNRINSWNGASYYHSGTLYCSNLWGTVCSQEIGSLSTSL